MINYSTTAERSKHAKPACASDLCISQCSHGYHCYQQYTGKRKSGYLSAVTLAIVFGLLFLWGSLH